MSYPKKLLRLRPSGFTLDIPSFEVPPTSYTGGNNVLFRRGLAGRIPGWRDAYTIALATVAPGEILHIIPVQFAGSNFWLIFEADGSAWALNTSVANQIDNALFTAVAQPNLFSSSLLNGIPIISNSTDEVVYWPGSGNMATLPGWTATESAGFVAVFRFHIFAMNIDGPSGTFRNLVKWSDAAEPGTVPGSWTPAADNSAGSAELADGKGAVLSAYPLRDNLVFYKPSTTYVAQWVAGNQKFAFRKTNSKNGSLGKHTVVDLGEVHLVVEQGDIVLSDAVNRKSIGESRVKDYFFNSLDEDNLANTFAIFYPPTGEVIIAFPSSGSDRADTGLIYNIAQDKFSIRDLPNIAHAGIGFVDDSSESALWQDATATWDAVIGTWASYNKTITATESLVFALAQTLEEQDTDDPQTIAAHIARHDLDFGEPERVKFVKRLHVRAEPGYGQLLVRVGSRMTPTDSIAWSNEVALDEPEQIVNVITQGRYISFEIRSNSDDVWTVTGVDIEAEMRGYH